MKHNVQMIVQYEINQDFSQLYQETMHQIMSMLPKFDAIDIHFQKSDTAPYEIIETFQLPTVAHYHALKKLRTSKKHSVFGTLDEIIPGGLKQMQCWALKKKS